MTLSTSSNLGEVNKVCATSERSKSEPHAEEEQKKWKYKSTMVADAGSEGGREGRKEEREEEVGTHRKKKGMHVCFFFRFLFKKCERPLKIATQSV